MKTFNRAFLLCSIACVAFLTSCDELSDFLDQVKKPETVSKKGLSIDGAQEVPPRDTPAKGTMDVSYDKGTKMLTYSIRWDNLTANPIGSHIHGTAPRGKNAGVKHDFTSLLPKSTSGSFTNSVKVDGVAIKEDSLLSGFYYINIHTPTYPGGEIRGQIEFK
jgi:hypothetical protein